MNQEFKKQGSFGDKVNSKKEWSFGDKKEGVFSKNVLSDGFLLFLKALAITSLSRFVNDIV